MKKLFAVALFIFSVELLTAQVRIGGSVPDISLPNTKDSIVHLSSLKGKIVLIDFWASWCPPCRVANRSTEWLYKKYKDQGFEVFGVSLDDKQSAWKRAIQKDKIHYTQVIDKSGQLSEVADAYGVSELPSTFLLDRDGTLLAINLEGKELKEMIEVLLQR